MNKLTDSGAGMMFCFPTKLLSKPVTARPKLLITMLRCSLYLFNCPD